MSNFLNPSNENYKNMYKILHYLGALFSGILVAFLGAMAFTGGMIFLQPVINACHNYLQTFTFSLGVDLVETFPLVYFVGFMVLAVTLFVMGCIRILDTVDQNGLLKDFVSTNDKKEVTKHEITQ